MSTLKGRNVPDWIKKSEKYKNRKNYEFDEDENIPLYDLDIKDIDDFENVMDTIQFWEIKSPYPYELWRFMFLNKSSVRNFWEKRKLVKKHEYFLQFIHEKIVIILFQLIIKNKEFNLLKFAVESEVFEKVEKYFNIAVERSDLETVIYLHENCFPWDEKTCMFAARNEVHGLEILKWLRGGSCPWGEWGCYGAAGNKVQGLEILKWLRGENPPCPWDEKTCTIAAKNKVQGLEMLKWMRSQNPPCPWNDSIITYAERNRVLGTKILKWIKTQNDASKIIMP